MTADDYARIYKKFDAPISRQFNCGKYCAAINGGTPVCCSTDDAVPVVQKTEWALLQSRTDLWKPFKAYDSQTRQIVKELPSNCQAVECKGAAFCERENRSFACRVFPFYPYFTREKKIAGLSYYWTFEDRCWILSNLWVAEKRFIGQILASYKYLFARDKDEEETLIDHSAQARRVFSRWGRAIPIIAPDGSYLKVLPKSGGKIVAATLKDFLIHAPYRTQKSYLREAKDSGGTEKSTPPLPATGRRQYVPRNFQGLKI